VFVADFWDVLWTMLLVFAWIAFFMLLFYVLIDLFSRHDISGWKKATWVIFLIVLPFIGILSYLVVNGDDMAKRRMKEAQTQQAATDEYIRSVAGASPADQIANAKSLLDQGAITQEEFDQLKTKALAS
jgi:predicted PurR-regulated permease PerM